MKILLEQADGDDWYEPSGQLATTQVVPDSFGKLLKHDVQCDESPGAQVLQGLAHPEALTYLDEVKIRCFYLA